MGFPGQEVRRGNLHSVPRGDGRGTAHWRSWATLEVVTDGGPLGDHELEGGEGSVFLDRVRVGDHEVGVAPWGQAANLLSPSRSAPPHWTWHPQGVERREPRLDEKPDLLADGVDGGAAKEAWALTMAKVAHGQRPVVMQLPLGPAPSGTMDTEPAGAAEAPALAPTGSLT